MITGSPTRDMGVMAGMKWEKKPDWPLMVKYWDAMKLQQALQASACRGTWLRVATYAGLPVQMDA